MMEFRTSHPKGVAERLDNQPASFLAGLVD